MSSYAHAPLSPRRIIIWSLVIAAALIALFAGIESASKNKTPALPAPSGVLDAVTSADHTRGGSIASRAALVEYSDFQCPACGAYYPLVKKLVDANGAKLEFTYRYFPLSQIHKNARVAALAAESAGAQGKFWEMHDALFESQTEWADLDNPTDFFAGLAGKIGLDLPAFKKNMNDAATGARIDRDYASGLKAGVDSTPSFFLNGARIENPRSYEEFQQLIDKVAAGS